MSAVEPKLEYKNLLIQFANDLGISLNISDHINDIILKKVEVFPKTASWVLHLIFPKQIKDWPLFWNTISKEILKKNPCLKEVRHIDYYQCSKTGPEAFVREYQQLFFDKVVKNKPVCAGWLSAARLDVKKNRIVLLLPDSLGVQYMITENMGEFLTFISQKYFGLTSQFIFEVDEKLNCNYKIPIKDIWPVRHIQQQTKKEEGFQKKQDKKNDVILGRQIKGDPKPIIELQDEEKKAVIQGQIVLKDMRELKSGRTLYTLDLSDHSDSISVKMFSDDKSKDCLKVLKVGQWLKAEGAIQYDKYTQELTLMARNINEVTPVLREDNAPKKRIELHLHTKMSSLDGLAEIGDVISTAARWGHPAIAITDHGVVQAFPEAFEASRKHKIKLIYGVEGYLCEDQNPKGASHHIVILAKNQKGLESLYKLVTLSHLEYFYRRPRIPKEALNELREGLLLGTACEAGELIKAYLSGKSDKELSEIASFYDYLEIQPIGNNEFLIEKGQVNSKEDLKKMNKKIIELGKRLNKPVVATGDVHFLNPENEIFRRILQSGQGYGDDPQAPLFLRTTEEMLEEFSYLGSDIAHEVVIEGPNLISGLIENITPLPEGLFVPEIPGAEDEIALMCREEATRLYGNPLPEIVNSRLEQELTSIISNGFAVLYLIAHKLVKKSNDDGYLVGSRGSVGSSLVGTFCGITEVNPLPPHYRCSHCRFSKFINDGSYHSGSDLPSKKCNQCGNLMENEGHDIPFETFLGFEGDKVPDIDLNFSGEYQAQAHKYAEELFGKDYVFRAGTISTIAEKTAFGFVKKYYEQKNTYKRNAEINRLVKGLSGVKRTTGQHPGGLIVIPKDKDINRFTPLQRPADDLKSGVITTHFDYRSISDRLVKLDILGHDDPTMIKMLGDLTGFDAKTISLDDQRTLSLFSGVEVLGVTSEQIRSTVGTYGIPEFGTKFVRQMLEETKPKKFSELVRISGFSHGEDVWMNNARDLINSGTATVSQVISTRDDIMIYLIYQGVPPELSFKIMEDVRKGRGLKPDYGYRMKQHGIPDWYIESCKKIKYMFPKAHAVAYVMMAFRIAYFKVNYPLAFYASYFTARVNDFDAQLITKEPHNILPSIEKIEEKGNEATAKEKNALIILEVAQEMISRGFSFYSVDLNESDAFKFKIHQGGLLAPFSSLQGVGRNAAISLVKARQSKSFTSIEDLGHRSKVTKTVIEKLKEHGALEGLPLTDQLSLF